MVALKDVTESEVSNAKAEETDFWISKVVEQIKNSIQSQKGISSAMQVEVKEGDSESDFCTVFKESKVQG